MAERDAQEALNKALDAAAETIDTALDVMREQGLTQPTQRMMQVTWQEGYDAGFLDGYRRAIDDLTDNYDDIERRGTISARPTRWRDD